MGLNQNQECNMSHPSVEYIKFHFDNGKVTAQFYNDHIFPAVQQGLIKDITPRGEAFRNNPLIVVLALVEFPNGDKYWLEIQEQFPPSKPPKYNVSTKKQV
jgi:hypothetical protein